VPRLVVYYGGYNGPAIGIPGGGESEGPLSVEAEVVVESNSALYPNPTSEFINIELPGTDEATISVVNMKGQIVHTTSSRGQKAIRVDLSGLKGGVYLIHVSQSGEKFTKRIIVE
jgi:hypothetical protein